jgi:endonuclease/exonuclease/phosphatase family metal-dependent hydrolase
MRIASFNVENLFSRARALDATTWDAGRPVLELQAEVNKILGQASYSDQDKVKIVELLDSLGLKGSDDGGKFALLRQNRGHLLTRHMNGEVEVIANGRDDWIGWVELKTSPVNVLSTRHTARVIGDVAPDILAVVEVESRPALKSFADVMLSDNGSGSFPHAMVIDGNDDRGIDVGVLLRDGYAIDHIRSHVDDKDARGTIFSRDCPEYAVTCPGGERVVALVNHLKSKGFGSQRENDAKRRRQAVRVAQVYKALQKAGESNIVIVGDFNDVPASAPLAPLLKQTDLKDISAHPSFDNGGRPGTFGNCTASNKIDYILLSPTLFSRVQAGGIFRKGAWGGTNGTLWEHYPGMTKKAEAASDHAAIWAEIA